MINLKFIPINVLKFVLNKCNKFLLAFMFIFLFESIPAMPQSLDNSISPDGLLETVFDNYGNRYSLSDIKIPDDSSSYIMQSVTCSPGYFNLFFENGWEGSTANAPAKEAVICQVLSDLSNFIVSPLNGSTTKVNIWVRNINAFIANPSTSITLGIATPFYCLPYNTTSNFGGIADNEIWKTIQSGTNSYTNVAAPLNMTSSGASGSGLNYYHGQMAFNFENSQVSWNLNLSNGSGTGQFDFYSTVLHEMMHALGFASTMNSNGNSIFGNGFNYYSRYDLFLRNNSESASLIVNGGDPCDMYNYYPNPNLSPISNVLEPSTVNCNTAIHYVSNLNTNSVPVYTTNPHSYSNISHFDDGCIVPSQPGQYFVMSPSVINGPSNTKRALTNEERLALCDMGYQTNTSFGSTVVNNITTYASANCPGIKVAGINDGFISSGPQTGQFSYIVLTGSNTITIPSTGTNGFLSNDHFSNSTNNSFSCPAIVSGPGNIVSSSSAGIVFQSSANLSLTGITLIRYIPIDGSTGNEGNISYIYVLSTANMNCTAVCDNLVPNGDFESLTVTGQFPNASQQISLAACWDRANSGTPDLFNTNSPTPSSSNNVHVPCSWFGFQDPKPSTTNTYAGLVRRDSPNTATQANELIYTKLSQPLLPSTNYQFTMDASLAETFRLKSYNLQVLFTNQLPSSGSNSGYPVLPTDILLPSSGNSFAITDVNIWTPITINFTTGALTGGANNEYLVIGNIENNWGISQNPPYNTPNCTTWPQTLNKIDESYVFIDNISLRLQANVVTFNLPSTMGISQVIQLSNFISPAWPGNGTFTSTNPQTQSAISGAGMNTFFDGAIAGIGTHVIDFSYINNLGCTIRISDVIIVDNCGFPAPIITLNTPLCEDQQITATVTNSIPGATYSWSKKTLLPPFTATLTGTCNLNPSCDALTFNYSPPTFPFNGEYFVNCNVPGCFSQSTLFTLNDIGFGACCIKPDVLFDENIKVSDANFPTINNGDVIFVRAGVTLTIDNNYSFTNCQFYFENSSKITVAAKTLTLTGCHLQGCESMWNGITLQGNANVVVANSMIENALSGISCGVNMAYTISHSIFNKNLNDIYVYGSPGNTTVFSGTIIGSVFTSRTLPHPTSLQPGAPTMYTYADILRSMDDTKNINYYPKSTLLYYPSAGSAKNRSGKGIQIDYVGATASSNYNIKIGDASNSYAAVGNLFDNHDYGVIAYQSNIEVVNNQISRNARL